LKISLLPSLHCLTFTFISIGLYQRPTASNLLFEHLHAIPLHYVLKSMILQFLTVHKSYRQFHICVVFFFVSRICPEEWSRRSFEILVSTYRTTLRHIPEDHNFNIPCSEKVKVFVMVYFTAYLSYRLKIQKIHCRRFAVLMQWWRVYFVFSYRCHDAVPAVFCVGVRANSDYFPIQH
jgi:hypothetical protein